MWTSKLNAGAKSLANNVHNHMSDCETAIRLCSVFCYEIVLTAVINHRDAILQKTGCVETLKEIITQNVSNCKVDERLIKGIAAFAVRMKRPDFILRLAPFLTLVEQVTNLEVNNDFYKMCHDGFGVPGFLQLLEFGKWSVPIDRLEAAIMSRKPCVKLEQNEEQPKKSGSKTTTRNNANDSAKPIRARKPADHFIPSPPSKRQKSTLPKASLSGHGKKEIVGEEEESCSVKDASSQSLLIKKWQDAEQAVRSSTLFMQHSRRTITKMESLVTDLKAIVVEGETLLEDHEKVQQALKKIMRSWRKWLQKLRKRMKQLCLPKKKLQRWSNVGNIKCSGRYDV
jgi:hypothetical protein